MTTFTKTPGGGLMIDGWPQTQKRELRAQVEQWLIDHEKLDPYEAETRSENLWIGRTWWSDTYNGQTHDCGEHGDHERGSGCFEDSRKVTMIAGAGEWDS